MPLKLHPPRAPKHPSWRIRGTYLGISVDRSSGTSERKVAAKLLATLKDEIERGAYAQPGAVTFASAAVLYMKSGGEKRYLTRLIQHFGEIPLAAISREDVAQAAVLLYPNATPATRNRQVFSPVSSVLKAGGVEMRLKRPKGARGELRLHWLKPEDAFALLKAADAYHPRFGALLTFLLYTGCRLTEGLSLAPENVHLSESFAYIGKTKNGQPRAVHLPPQVVAALANVSQDWGESRVFRWHRSARLYSKLDEVATVAGVTIPDGIAFHIFRHTYGAWMRRYQGMDTTGLVATGAWKSRQAAAIYEHADVTEEARKADGLPTPGWEQSGRNKGVAS